MEKQFSSRQVGEFLLRACHDLRSSIRAVKAHAELLRRDDHPERNPNFPEVISFITEGAGDADRLVEAITAYSIALQIDPGSFRPAPLGVLLRAVIAKLQTRLNAAGAEVNYSDLPSINGNQDRLMELFQQLLTNALVHAGEAPRIDISARRTDGFWTFAVHDNGPCVEAPYLERIFEPFERGRGREVPGSGLGLAISRLIVENHGGKIWAEAPGGGGCTFLFTLPA